MEKKACGNLISGHEKFGLWEFVQISHAIERLKIGWHGNGALPLTPYMARNPRICVNFRPFLFIFIL
jgi:hypothetical protein